MIRSRSCIIRLTLILSLLPQSSFAGNHNHADSIGTKASDFSSLSPHLRYELALHIPSLIPVEYLSHEALVQSIAQETPQSAIPSIQQAVGTMILAALNNPETMGAPILEDLKGMRRYFYPNPGEQAHHALSKVIRDPAYDAVARSNTARAIANLPLKIPATLEHLYDGFRSLDSHLSQTGRIPQTSQYTVVVHQSAAEDSVEMSGGIIAIWPSPPSPAGNWTNSTVVSLVSRELGTPIDNLRITNGATSRYKIISAIAAPRTQDQNIKRSANKPLIVVTRNMPQEVLDYLKNHFEVDYYNFATAIPRGLLLEKAKNAVGLLPMLSDKIDSELFKEAPDLKIVATNSVGMDHIDSAEATRRGVLVTNTPDVLTETCADFAFLLLMAVARRILEGDRIMRAGQFNGWDVMDGLGKDIYRKTLGIIGFGRIGQAVARRARGFNMRILYSGNGSPNPVTLDSVGPNHVGLEQLLRASDFISLHLPLKPETRHLINHDTLRMMKRSAILINTARGPIVDENALVAALREGIIWGAGLDVYEQEPKMASGLGELSNVVLAPHWASATYETRQNMGMMAAESLVKYLIEGQIPENAANNLAQQSSSPLKP